LRRAIPGSHVVAAPSFRQLASQSDGNPCKRFRASNPTLLWGTIGAMVFDDELKTLIFQMFGSRVGGLAGRPPPTDNRAGMDPLSSAPDAQRAVNQSVLVLNARLAIRCQEHRAVQIDNVAELSY
jgi:hypothetical protein